MKFTNMVVKGLGLWVLFFIPEVCLAQTIPGTDAPELKTTEAVDSYGIDLVSGEPLISGVQMSIGAAQSGINIADNSFNGMRTSYSGSVTYMQSAGTEGGCDMLPAGQFFDVSTGADRAVFRYVQGSENQTLVRGRGVFKFRSTDFLYIARDGTEYKFNRLYTGAFPAGAGSSGCQQRHTQARLNAITKPSGEIIDINYRIDPVVILGNTVNLTYFTSVRSSLGWMFKRERLSLTQTSTSIASKSASFFVNLSMEYCGASVSESCANMSMAWPKFELDQSSSRATQQNTYSGDLTNPLGKVTKLAYDYSKSTSSFETTLTSPAGLVKKYKKNCTPTCADSSSGRVSSFTQGSITISGYGNRSLEPSNYADHTSVMNEASGPNGKVRYVPTNAGFPFSFIDNLSRSTVNSYQTSTWLLEEIGITGDSKTRAVYDARGNVTSITQKPKIEGDAPLVTSFTYPAESTCASSPKTCNKPETMTDQKGVVTTYTYHSHSGYVDTITKPAVDGIKAQTRFKYEQLTPYIKNSGGALVASSPVWVLTEISECMTQSLNACVGTADEKKTTFSDFTYNLLPQRVTTQNGDGSISLVTLTEYDMYGNVIAVDGSSSGTDDKIYYFYDLMRQKVGEIGIDPDGTGPLPRQAIKMDYNDDGKVVSVNTGVTSGITKADLDAMTVKQQVVTEYSTDHGLPVVERLYAANVLEKVTQKSYDNKLRIECVAQRLNRNAWSSLPASACTLGTAGSEGNDRIAKYTYDATGAVLSITSGYGTTLQRVDRTNTYDLVNGLLKTEADGKGNTTFYKYDNFNRLFKTVYPTSTNGTAESTTDYTQTTYKSGSSLVESVRLRDGLIINFSEYDALGRVKTKAGALSESFTYNNFNQVATHTNNSTGGVAQSSSYIFNSLGWLTSESRIAGGLSLGSVSYGYDAIGRRTSLTWPDNFSVNYDYKVNGVDGKYLRKITESNGALLAEFDYYDNGRRKKLKRGNGVITSYGYNDLEQLKTLATNVGGASTADDIAESFTYMTSGQLKNRSLAVRNNNYIYEAGVAAVNNYIPDALNRVASVNGVSFGYDGRGNLTTDNTGTTYTYNANNLLLNATKAGVVTTLSYDAENRLYSLAKSGATTKFMYDGTDLIAETDASNNILRRYIHGPETDDPIVWYEGSGTGDKRYYTANNQGSIVGITLQSGMSTSINAYDEYGIQKLTTIGRFQYTGQTWLPEVGLYYYKARLYSPSLGRFMQTDPVGYKDGMNWYAYVGNDPVNRTDPSGTTCKMIGNRFECKVDDPGKLKPKEVARIEKAYTKAVNNLLKNPNKTSKVTVKDKTFTVNAGDQAKALIGAKVIGGTRAKARAHAEGGPLHPDSESGGPEITVNRNVLNDVGEDRISRTMIHESIHLNPAEKVMQELWDADPKQFNKDHRDPYNKAAYELF